MDNKKYFVFISYSSKDNEDDNKWAEWLRHELDHWHLPTTYNGRKPVQENLREVFRDRDGFCAGKEWDKQVEPILKECQNLIVICSPNAAKSEAVNKEVEFFINQGKGDRIFPFIVEGDSPKDCFPSALIHSIVGGDVNKDGGRDAAFIKVVAGMLGVDFSDLYNRYELDKAEQERIEREKKEKLQIAQSRFLAEKANQLVDEGDSYLASLLALKALPKDIDNPDRPYVPEAEAALRNAVTRNSAILRGHKSKVRTAMFSPNGDYILSFSEDKTIRVWNTIDGSCINEYPNGTIAAHFLTTSENPVFVSIMNNALQRWDVTQNNVLESSKADFYHEKLFCFTQDGTRLYSISIGEYNLNIWDVEKGKRIRSIKMDEIKNTNCMAVSSNGRLLACGVKDVIRLYDLRTENLLITYQRPHEYINHIAFNSTGDMIASSTWKTITLWNSSDDYLAQNANTITDKFFKTFDKDNHDGDVLSLFFSSDGQELISTSKDCSVKIWDINKGTCETLQGHIYDVNSAQISPDKCLIVSASSDKTIRLWDYGRRPTFRIIPLEKYMFRDYSAFSPHCDSVAVADGNIARLLDVRTGGCRRTFEGHEKSITQLAYSPLGDTLLTTSLDDTIRIWKIETDGCRVLDQAIDSNFFITFSSDGKMVATGGQTEDRKTVVKIWNIEKIWDEGDLITPVKIIYYDNDDAITAATFSFNNEYIIALGLFGNLYEFKVNDGSDDYFCRKVFENNIVNARILMTKSNEYIIYTTGIGDLCNPLIYIWDRKKQNLMNPLSGHTDCVISINLNSDGTLIVSASKDKTIKIWNVKSGVCLRTLHGHTEEVVNAVFLDDEHVISVSHDNTIITWEYPCLKQLINATYDRFKKRKLTDEEKKKYYLE